MSRLLMLSLLLVVSIAGVQAEIDVYPFENPEQEVRFRALINEFRCPKCQNQNLSDSNAPLAKDLRGVIHEQIQAGKSDQEIADYLQSRYGDFVLYKPPVKSNTALLWFGPASVLLLVMVWLFRRKALSETEISGSLTDEERKRLQSLMSDKKDSA